MKRLTVSFLKHTVRILAYGLAGMLLLLVTGFVLYLDDRPDLQVWHTADLDAEFTEDSPVDSFADYLELETRLFDQLEEQVYARIRTEDRRAINRYHRGSLSDPARWDTDWNRSFERTSDNPRAGVLLLHGMSDSPYSLRHLGDRLHAAGATVLGLRIPGHGTAPVGLTTVRWQDMAAAVRLAMKHLSSQAGASPLYIVGYSNGGALAVNYALESLRAPDMPPAQGLILVSPAIGVSPAAALAVWQSRLGYLLGLDKLLWSSIVPEYDPFKYGSFAVNAGDLVYRLTNVIQTRLDDLDDAELARFPPILAFQSVVDATVSAPALVKGLFQRLHPGDHELVLLGINRLAEVENILTSDPKPDIERLLSGSHPAFDITFLTNEGEASHRLVEQHQNAGEATITTRLTDMHWPDEVYSLSHIALPIPENDPLYGDVDRSASPGIQIGGLLLHGERGLLQIPAADMLRLRWNPFFEYLQTRALNFTRLSDPR